MVILAGIVLTVVGMKAAYIDDLGVPELIQTLEAGINEVVMIGIGLLFVWTLESRLKRRRALRALHELRSIAHLIDMHQLIKDPDRPARERIATSSSPKMMLDAYQLRRYLDYCSKMLSLTSKVTALHL